MFNRSRSIPVTENEMGITKCVTVPVVSSNEEEPLFGVVIYHSPPQTESSPSPTETSHLTSSSFLEPLSIDLPEGFRCSRRDAMTPDHTLVKYIIHRKRRSPPSSEEDQSEAMRRQMSNLLERQRAVERQIQEERAERERQFQEERAARMRLQAEVYALRNNLSESRDEVVALLSQQYRNLPLGSVSDNVHLQRKIGISVNLQ